MATFIIPTRTDITDYDMVVGLDGVSFILGFIWNYREEAWFMSVLAADETPIASGVRIVVDELLLEQVRGTLKPAGDLIAVDTTGAQVDPGIDDLGANVLLFYSEAS